jgi:uncharacterized membrane protein HdeD (DUF308 family)
VTDELPEVMREEQLGRRVFAELGKMWWLPLLRGILLAVLGIYALVNPGMTIAVFAQVMGFFLVIDGCFAVLAGVLAQVPSRGWTVMRGTISIVGGVFVFANPIIVAGVTAVAIIYLVAFALILSGILEIVAAIQDRKHIEGEGWLIFSGTLAVIFGVLLLIAPLSFGLLMVRFLGALAIVLGIAMVAFAFRLKALAKLVQHP